MSIKFEAGQRWMTTAAGRHNVVEILEVVIENSIEYIKYKYVEDRNPAHFMRNSSLTVSWIKDPTS